MTSEASTSSSLSACCTTSINQIASSGRAARHPRFCSWSSAVCDDAEPVIKWVEEAQGWRGTDQALRGKGCRPSPAWVEQACADAGFTAARDISNPLGNWEIGWFDWTPMGTGESRRDGVNFRKMWVCER